jgi:tetratricopeptide (TPR) repeat protein
MVGLADIAHAQGRFNDAVRWLNTALFYSDEPALHYQLGQLYSEMGQNETSLFEFESAQKAAPNIAAYNLALGDACLTAGDVDCARTQFTAAVENGNYPDEVTRVTGLADLWRQRNMYGQALPLYEDVVERWPSVDNQLMLASAYLETDRFEQAEALLTALRSAHPLSTEAIALAASAQAAQEKFDEAVSLFDRAILLQEIQGKISTETSLSLAQT